MSRRDVAREMIELEHAQTVAKRCAAELRFLYGNSGLLAARECEALARRLRGEFWEWAELLGVSALDTTREQVRTMIAELQRERDR